MYGEEFAREQVAVEKRRGGVYRRRPICHSGSATSPAVPPMVVVRRGVLEGEIERYAFGEYS
jgi:hypothetical protein